MTPYYRVGLEYIRARHKVPARRESRVAVCGRFGVITGSSGDHVPVRFDGDARAVTHHPVELDHVEAGEAVGPAG